MPQFPLLKSCSAVAIFASVIAAVPAHAQHAAPKIPAGQDQPQLPISEMMGDPIEDPLASELESMFVAKLFESEVADDFDPGVLMAVRAAYAQDLFRPIWTRNGADSLRRAKADLFTFGLIPSDVSQRDLKAISETRFSGVTVEERARADLELTAAYLRMASAISAGLGDEGQAAQIVTKRPVRSLLVESLKQAGEGDVAITLTNFEPEHPQYKGLKKALNHYRTLKTNGGWLAIPDGDAIEPGDTDKRVPALRDRLRVEGYDTLQPLNDILDIASTISEKDLSDPSQQELVVAFLNTEAVTYDDELVDAVKAFQRRHGLADDGIVGGRTLEALNESPASKIDRIADTMNRWRRHGDFGQRYIWANIPSYRAEAWADGKREIEMRTIVGSKSRQTPVFSDEIEFFVANPKWYVPVSLARRDKAPKLAKDPNYAKRQNFAVFDRATGAAVSPYLVDWTDPSSATKYRLVQQPGSNNALGEMKIIFPNQYSVYLHGTPGKSLFDRSQRAFSSGCVRLEDPVTMARWLARYDESIDVEDIQQALSDDDRERFDLEQQTGVHITYMTVTVNDQGQPYFWRDVYEKDDGISYVEKYANLYEDISPMTLTNPDGVEAINASLVDDG